VFEITKEEVMVYRYRAYTLDKRIVQGTIDAASERTAEEALYQAGYQRVLKLREISHGLTLSRWLPGLFGVKTEDVIDFSRQMAALIESGIPILATLRLLEEQAPTKALRKVITGLVKEILEGSSFSQALTKYPQAFSDTYCQAIKASELAGNLEVALRQVADHLEKETAAVKKVRRALVYPAVVLLLAFGVFTLLTTVALPPLVRLFTSLGGELPWTTKFLLVMGGFFTSYKFYLLGVLGALIILIFGYMRLPAGKLTTDRLVLKIPKIGNITIQRNMCRFCQTTSMLLKAGLPLPQIMNVVIKTVKNAIICRALEEVRGKLVQGQGLSQPMASIDVFPQLLVEMVVVGETTGTLDTTLATMADLYEQRVEQRVQALISMIEPALMIVVGLVVAFIAVSMITPLYSILKTMY
jgi:type IV pilus assembly protein PilC